MPYFKCSLGDGGKTTAIKLGSGAGTYDVAAVYKGYKNLIADNFIVETNTAVGWTTYGNAITINSGGVMLSGYVSSAKKSYDPSTGMLTVSTTTASLAFPNASPCQCLARHTVSAVWLVIS